MADEQPAAQPEGAEEQTEAAEAPPTEQVAATPEEKGEEQSAETEAAAPQEDEKVTEGEGEAAAPSEGAPTDASVSEAVEGEGEGAPQESEAGEEQVAAEEPAKEEDTEGASEATPDAEAQPAGDGQSEEGATEGQVAEGEEGEAKSASAEGGVEEGADEKSPEEEEEGETAKSPVPQSDTFAEGERPESPVAIGEKLSREGSPTEEKAESPEPVETGRTASPPVPGTPDQGSLMEGDEGEEEMDEDEEEEEEYEEYDDEPQFNRDELIERYHQALAEREQFQQQNYQLQHKLAEYFRKKKSDDARQDMDKNVTDQEQRYLKYMANLDELRRQDAEERENYKMIIEEVKERCQEKQARVEDERSKFTEFKQAIAFNSINSRSGKPIPPKDIESYLSTENRKEAEVVNVRLENIKLKNKLRKKEQQLKSKEELAEGLHLIDFEQLKIENQTYNEKIEERNEELLKLRKKITSTVQVLTHLKEKLQFVQAENHVQKGSLREVEELAARKRDILSRTKQARDALRIDNNRLKQNCGLLGNEPLLRDFEERKDESDLLGEKLEHLKMQHAELTMSLTGVRRKIEQAKGGRQ